MKLLHLRKGLLASLISLVFANAVLVHAQTPETRPQVVSPSEQEALLGKKPDRLVTDALNELENGNLSKASSMINSAIQLKPGQSYLHLINGLIYHLQSKRGENISLDIAREGYETAIRFDQNNFLAHYFLGLLYAETNEMDKAKKSIANALYYRPDDPAILNAFAYVAYRAGSPDLAAGAIRALEKAGELKTIGQFRNAAMIYASVGEKEKSRNYLKIADGFQGSNPEFVRRLGDWDSLYKSDLVQRVNAPAAALPSPTPLANALNQIVIAGTPPLLPLTAPGTENKMIVVDVVLIATEEDFSTSAGLNLFRDFNLSYSATRASTYNALVSDTTITRALTIPAVIYSLNIANTTNNRNEILSRPTLVASAGQSAEFFSGIDLNAVAFPTGAAAGGAAVQPISIQKEIGVRLQITPSVTPDGLLNLKIAAQRTFIKPPNQDVFGFASKLETSKAAVNTNVVMRFGESLILGGLSEKELTNTRDGVPGLQEVPGLQYFFSQKTTADVQKSVLILITPRPPQYIYQTERARAEYEKTLREDERPLANLRARYADWFEPYPNWASVFHHLQDSSLYREFRTGDVTLETWSDMRTLKNRLKHALDFLHY